MSANTIPQEFYPIFTMNGAIPVSQAPNQCAAQSAPFTQSQVDHYIALAKMGRTQSLTDSHLYSALAKFPVKDKSVAVLGSTSPWYESILLCQGAIPTTLSEEPIADADPRLKIERSAPEKSFDAVFCLLNLKSLGLGSKIDPNADLEEMKKAKSLIKPDGLLYLSIPVGKDRLVWNSHRIYGELRMKALFKGWRPLGYFGYSYEDLLKDIPRIHEPVIVLKPLQ